MSVFRHPRTPLRSLWLALLAAVAIALPATFSAAATPPEAVPAAGEANPIEGVWSFNGGAVAVKSIGKGRFQGIVVRPTKFATCVHTEGELMWSDMRARDDGSYWGYHQWFSNGAACDLNPELGLTAWRVLVAADGTRRLEVCFSMPGDRSQPTIGVDGKAGGATFGCAESSPLAVLPGGRNGPKFEQLVELPKGLRCKPRQALRIKLHSPKYDPLKRVIVKVGKKKVRDVTDPAALKKPVVLHGLPEHPFKVTVIAITVLNERVKGSRRYRPCGSPPGKKRLPVGASHRND